jgi:hypothetical protein
LEVCPYPDVVRGNTQEDEIVRSPNEMEQRLKVEDRGPVDPFNVGNLRWVVSCARCMHTAHVVITHGTFERKYACPRCLVFLDGSVHPPEPSPPDITRCGKYKAVTNRIRRYL